jgi:hypothetical protein
VRSGERCLVVEAQRSPARLAAMEARIAHTAREIVRCTESGDWPLSTPDGVVVPEQWSFWSSCPGGG